MSASFIEDMKKALPKHVLSHIGDKYIQGPKRKAREDAFNKSMPVPELREAVPARFDLPMQEHWSDKYMFHFQNKDYTITATYEEDQPEPFEFVLHDGKFETRHDYINKESLMFLKMTGDINSMGDAAHLNIEKDGEMLNPSLRHALIRALMTLMRRYFKNIDKENITVSLESLPRAPYMHLTHYMESIKTGGAAKKIRYTSTHKEYTLRTVRSGGAVAKYIMLGGKRTYLKDIRGQYRYV